MRDKVKDNTTASLREMHSAEEISSRLFLCIYFIEVIDNMFTEWDWPPFISHSIFLLLRWERMNENDQTKKYIRRTN